LQNVNFSFSLISDIIVVLLLITFALIGRKRGFVKMISGILVLVLSITAAGMLSKWTTPYISSVFIEPRITELLMPEVQAANAPSTSIDEPKTDSISSLLLKLGFSTDSVATAINDFKKAAVTSVENAVASLSESVSVKISYIITFIAFLLVSLLVFSLLVRLLNLAAKLPVISFFNHAGGFIIGAIFGYLIIFIVASLLINFNLLITRQLASNTVVLNFILTKNPLTLLPIWQ